MKKGQKRRIADKLRGQFASNVIYLVALKFPKADYPDQALAVEKASTRRGGQKVGCTGVQRMLTGDPEEMTGTTLETLDSLADAFGLDHPYELLDPKLQDRLEAKKRKPSREKRSRTTRPSTTKRAGRNPTPPVS